MLKQRLTKCVAVASLVAMLGGVGLAQAQTDDARVLDGINSSTNMYTYLNSYPYHLWKSNHQNGYHDTYISKDNCVVVDLYNNQLRNIYLLSPGYTTDKGIQVGMTKADILNVYGPVYELGNEPTNKYVPYGYIASNAKLGKDSEYANYTGYDAVYYISPSNEEITFIIDHKTSKIATIVYTANRQNTISGFDAALKLGLVKELKAKK